MVLMEGTWYLSLPALLKHVCTDNFVQDEAISIKIIGKFRYNCGMLNWIFSQKCWKLKELLEEMTQIIAAIVKNEVQSIFLHAA